MLRVAARPAGSFLSMEESSEQLHARPEAEAEAEAVARAKHAPMRKVRKRAQEAWDAGGPFYTPAFQFRFAMDRPDEVAEIVRDGYAAMPDRGLEQWAAALAAVSSVGWRLHSWQVVDTQSALSYRSSRVHAVFSRD